MTLGIVTSRTVRSYSRRPQWPYTVNWDSPQAQGLVRWCPGDPRGSQFIFDLVNGKNGVFAGSWSWVSSADAADCLVPQAPNLGSSQIQFTQMGFANPSSFFAWISPRNVSVGDRRLWTISAGVVGGASRQVNTEIQLLDTAGVSWGAVVAGLTVEWQHVGAVYLASGSATGYRNGVVGSTVVNTTPTMWQSQNWTFGSNYAGFGEYYEGRLNDLRVYNIEVPQNVIEQMWDGNTRWDLYYQPGLRSWLLPSTTVATGRFNAAWSAGNKLIGGGIC